MPPGIGYGHQVLQGMPLGSIGPTGINVSPALEIYAQFVRRQLANQQAQQQAANRKMDFSLANMRLGAQAEQAQLSRDFEAEQAEAQRAYGREQGMEGRKLRKKELGLREASQRFSRARAQKADKDADARRRQEEDEARRAREEAEAAEREQGRLSQVGGRTRAIIAQRASSVAQELEDELGRPPTPEEMRDYMLAESGESDVTPKERLVMQQAIKDWYDDEVAAEKREPREEEGKARKATATSQFNHWRGEVGRLQKEISDLRRTIVFLDQDPAQITGDSPEAQDARTAIRLGRGALATHKADLAQLKKELEYARNKLNSYME